MRAFLFLALALVCLTLMALADEVQAETKDSNATGSSESNTKVQLAFILHAEKVEQEKFAGLNFLFSTKDLEVEPDNLSFVIEYTRVTYQDSATEVVNDLNRTSLAAGSSDDGRAGSVSASNGGNDSERQEVEAKYKFDWRAFPNELSYLNNTELWQFKLKGELKVPVGYYLFRIQVMDKSENDTTLLWLYSKQPLKVYVKQIMEEVNLHILTRPDFEGKVLEFEIRYEGPFLENPVVYVTATHLGLNNFRVNVTGIMSSTGGKMTGNITFAPLPIPLGTYELRLWGQDASERIITAHSQFTLKALQLSKEIFNQLSSDSGKLDVALAVSDNLSNARLSLEELDVNPAAKPNQTALLARYGDQLTKGKIESIGRYLSVEPSNEIKGKLDNATLRFWVNQTDQDEKGRELLGRVFGLRVFYYNESSEAWELVNMSGYDKRGFVWAHIPHFSIYALFGTNVAPSASADPNSLTTEVDQLVQLDGSGTDLDGQIIEWAWDFEGDGTYDFISNVSGAVQHTYEKSGIYAAKLRVTDEQGATGFAYLTITVEEPAEEGTSGLPLPLYVTLVALVLAVAYRHKNLGKRG